MQEIESYEDLLGYLGSESDSLSADGGKNEDCFRNYCEFRRAFVVPQISRLETLSGEGDQERGNKDIVFVTARGASGKSITAEAVSSRSSAVLWKLENDDAVGGASLKAHLVSYLRHHSPEEMINENIQNGRSLAIVIDSLDEARASVTAKSWAEFIQSIADYARIGVKFALFGRRSAVDESSLLLSERGIGSRIVEITHFDRDARKEYVDQKAESENLASHLDQYLEARDAILESLEGVVDERQRELFVGYPPVLDAVSSLLKRGKAGGLANYRKITEDFRGIKSRESVVAQIKDIVTRVLEREQRKFNESPENTDIKSDQIYTPNEQIDWLLFRNLDQDEPDLSFIEDLDAREAYRKKVLDIILVEHPFHDDGRGWASPVFSAYCAAERFKDIYSAEDIVELGSGSSLLYDFIVDGNSGTLDLDEWKLAALRNSSLSGKGDGAMPIECIVEGDSKSLKARFVVNEGSISHETLACTVNPESSELRVRGDLSDLTIDYDGTVIFEGSKMLSTILGPNISVKARKVEFAGAEVVITAGPEEINRSEVSVEFSVDDCPTGNLGKVPYRSALLINVKEGASVPHPWRTYLEWSNGEVDDLVKEYKKEYSFVSRLMALTRNHGHAGDRAVFISKLRGRSSYANADFYKAVDVLVRHGVVRQEGDMIYVNSKWEEHRFSPSSEGGMEFANHQEAWAPVLEDLSRIR